MVSTRRVISTSLSPFSFFLSLSLSLSFYLPRHEIRSPLPSFPKSQELIILPREEAYCICFLLRSTPALTKPSRTENLPPRAGRFTSSAHIFSLTKKCFVQLLSVRDIYFARSLPVGISSFQTNVSRPPFPQLCSSTRIYFEYCINYFLFRTYP